MTAIKRVGKDRWGSYKWLCKCDCNNQTTVAGSSLRRGLTKSCGCLRKKGNNLKHGHSIKGKESTIYKLWENMIQRCGNPNNKQYKDYGGRGIIVCERWLRFKNFNEDMGKEWKSGLTIERIKNKEGYSPENCKWATKKTTSKKSTK